MDIEQKVRTISLIVDGMVVGTIVTLQIITICKYNSIVEDLQSQNTFQQTALLCLIVRREGRGVKLENKPLKFI